MAFASKHVIAVCAAVALTLPPLRLDAQRESSLRASPPIASSIAPTDTAPIFLRTLASLARVSAATTPDSSPTTPAPKIATSNKRYWTHMAVGFVSSILAHEAAHIGTALAVGAKPSIGFDKGRPTVYSGINAETEKRKQFLFSSAGLTLQAILDEAILDIPHGKGGAFERGILVGGISTAYFYATIGRNASNSDITFMARTSSLSKTQASLIYASIATLHVIRIARDEHYANFFIRPRTTQPGLAVGVAILHE